MHTFIKVTGILSGLPRLTPIGDIVGVFEMPPNEKYPKGYTGISRVRVDTSIKVKESVEQIHILIKKRATNRVK